MALNTNYYLESLNGDLANKQSLITGAATTVTSNNLAANMVIRTNANGKIGVSQITVSELNALSGIKDNIQNQLNSKANVSTAITTSNIGSQSVNYANSAGSAPANGGNASTVGGYSADGLKVKFYNLNLKNVACTKKSANGCYYTDILDGFENHGITQNDVVSIIIVGWGGAVASFTPYCQNNGVRIMSDISQTITAIDLRVAYITY